MIRLIIGLIMLVQVYEVAAQSPYALSWKKDAPLLGGGILGAGVSIWVQKGVKPYTPAQADLFKPGQVNSFDRKATRWYNKKAGKWSDYLFESSLLMPVALLADRPIREKGWQTGLIGLESLLWSSVLTAMTKALVLRPRPYMYNPDVPTSDKLSRDGRFSFFSGHTSGTACLSVTAAKIWTDYHPGNKWNPLVWGTALAWPAAVGFLRVKAGKHFPTDVLVGYAVGAACGWLIPQWHKKS